MSTHTRLAAANLTLPEPHAPGGHYSPTVTAGTLLSIAAQFPMRDGAPAFRGRLGEDLDSAQGYAAAQLAALNALARIERDVGLDRLVRIVHVDAFLLTTPDFAEHARVLDGASDTLHTALAERAGHTRALCGVYSLPGRMPVELVIKAEVTPD